MLLIKHPQSNKLVSYYQMVYASLLLEIVIVSNQVQYTTRTLPNQWRSQDLKDGGARTFVREVKNFSHAPQMLTTPLIKHILEGSWPTRN